MAAEEPNSKRKDSWRQLNPQQLLDAVNERLSAERMAECLTSRLYLRAREVHYKLMIVECLVKRLMVDNHHLVLNIDKRASVQQHKRENFIWEPKSLSRMGVSVVVSALKLKSKIKQLFEGSLNTLRKKSAIDDTIRKQMHISIDTEILDILPTIANTPRVESFADRICKINSIHKEQVKSTILQLLGKQTRERVISIMETMVGSTHRDPYESFQKHITEKYKIEQVPKFFNPELNNITNIEVDRSQGKWFATDGGNKQTHIWLCNGQEWKKERVVYHSLRADKFEMPWILNILRHGDYFVYFFGDTHVVVGTNGYGVKSIRLHEIFKSKYRNEKQDIRGYWNYCRGAYVYDGMLYFINSVGTIVIYDLDAICKWLEQKTRVNEDESWIQATKVDVQAEEIAINELYIYYLKFSGVLGKISRRGFQILKQLNIATNDPLDFTSIGCSEEFIAVCGFNYGHNVVFLFDRMLRFCNKVRFNNQKNHMHRIQMFLHEQFTYVICMNVESFVNLLVIMKKRLFILQASYSIRHDNGLLNGVLHGLGPVGADGTKYYDLLIFGNRNFCETFRFKLVAYKY